jgi:hypothetical protein
MREADGRVGPLAGQHQLLTRRVVALRASGGAAMVIDGNHPAGSPLARTPRSDSLRSGGSVG